VRELFTKEKDLLANSNSLSSETRRVFVTLVQNLEVFCLNNEEFEVAKKLAERLKSELLQTKMYRERVLQYFYDGCIDAGLGDIKEAVKSAELAFSIMDVLEPNLCAPLKQYFTENVLTCAH
jgi:hypothetical protein